MLTPPLQPSPLSDKQSLCVAFRDFRNTRKTCKCKDVSNNKTYLNFYIGFFGFIFHYLWKWRSGLNILIYMQLSLFLLLWFFVKALLFILPLGYILNKECQSYCVWNRILRYWTNMLAINFTVTQICLLCFWLIVLMANYEPTVKSNHGKTTG